MNIYLDFNASTPLAPEVIDAMLPFLRSHFGNPSSSHWAGRPAKDAITHARQQVARLIGCADEEIVFTSGGSEANNFAIVGSCLENVGACHIITSAVEHPAVLEPCRYLERLGAPLTVVPVNGVGVVDPDDIRRAITPRTRLISVMSANNEVGAVQPIEEIGRIAREHGILFHSDAAQSIGKMPMQVGPLNVDLLSVAGHKLYAPKGVGALYIRQRVRLEPFIHGAGHESGRRAGTENTLGIVGLGAACEVAAAWVDNPMILDLRNYFWNELKSSFGSKVVLNGPVAERLPNTLNVSFPNRVGADILARLEGVAASTGSACHSGSVHLSPVLAAMGIAPEVGMGAIRFSLGRTTTKAEIDAVVAMLVRILHS